LSSADYNRTHPPWRHAGIRLRRLVRCLSNAGVSQGLALGVNRIHISDYFLACLVSPWGSVAVLLLALTVSGGSTGA